MTAFLITAAIVCLLILAICGIYRTYTKDEKKKEGPDHYFFIVGKISIIGNTHFLVWNKDEFEWESLMNLYNKGEDLSLCQRFHILDQQAAKDASMTVATSYGFNPVNEILIVGIDENEERIIRRETVVYPSLGKTVTYINNEEVKED